MRTLVLRRAAATLAMTLAATGAAAEPAPLTAGAPGTAPSAVPDTLAQRARACTGCHQATDVPVRGGYIPRIAGKPAGYLEEQLLNFRDGRRVNEAMARLLRNLGDDYLRELAGHFAALPPSAPPRAPGGPALDAAAAARAADWVRRGDPSRGIPACMECHGQALTGIAPRVPGLLGLPGDYLVGQLGAWRNGVRHARTPDCMADIARRLPADAVPEIARWLAAQPLPADPRATSSAPARWPLRCGSLER